MTAKLEVTLTLERLEIMFWFGCVYSLQRQFTQWFPINQVRIGKLGGSGLGVRGGQYLSRFHSSYYSPMHNRRLTRFGHLPLRLALYKQPVLVKSMRPMRPQNCLFDTNRDCALLLQWIMAMMEGLYIWLLRNAQCGGRWSEERKIRRKCQESGFWVPLPKKRLFARERRIYGYASGCKPEAFYLSTATSCSDAQREKKRRVLQVEETSRKSSRKG